MDSTVVAFRKLHESGCFVIPNPWDPGSAVFLQHLGFKALATTSAGYAFSQAAPDGGIARDKMLRHIREIVAATPLPVNADFEGGHAVDPEATAINALMCVRTGVAGLSIEDSTKEDPSNPLLDQQLAVDRIKAVRATIDSSESGVVLTARCEAFLVGHPDAKKIVMERLPLFAEAGADCLYAPAIKDPETIAEIVKLVAPKPVNVLAGAGFTVKQLEDLGVRRISVGAALARAAWGGFITAAREIAENGSFESFKNAAASADLNGLFRTAGDTRAG